MSASVRKCPQANPKRQDATPAAIDVVISVQYYFTVNFTNLPERIIQFITKSNNQPTAPDHWTHLTGIKTQLPYAFPGVSRLIVVCVAGVLREETGGGPRVDARRRRKWDLWEQRRLQGEGIGVRGTRRGPLLLGQLRAGSLLHGSPAEGREV